MSVTFEKLSDDPILIVTYTNPYRSTEDMEATNAKCAELLEELDTPLYRIQDIRQIELDFSKLIAGMAAASVHAPGSIRDPQVKTLIVGESDLVKFGSESVGQQQYGNLDVKMFSTLEDALAYAHQR